MNNRLFIARHYDGVPLPYRNFYEKVVKPLYEGNPRADGAFDGALKNYNGYYNGITQEIVFDTEQDLTMFLLKFS